MICLDSKTQVEINHAYACYLAKQYIDFDLPSSHEFLIPSIKRLLMNPELKKEFIKQIGEEKLKSQLEDLEKFRNKRIHLLSLLNRLDQILRLKQTKKQVKKQVKIIKRQMLEATKGIPIFQDSIRFLFYGLIDLTNAKNMRISFDYPVKVRLMEYRQTGDMKKEKIDIQTEN